ncbi:hypothetical protein PUN28_019874 [Cardiocondyla obscurior]|uniref:Uncharacterized protein n=1 Tax=Cardiocondyla obscurior TaxID=286306 RepID=A0AAW2E9V4_9HYME
MLRDKLSVSGVVLLQNNRKTRDEGDLSSRERKFITPPSQPRLILLAVPAALPSVFFSPRSSSLPLSRFLSRVRMPFYDCREREERSALIFSTEPALVCVHEGKAVDPGVHRAPRSNFLTISARFNFAGSILLVSLKEDQSLAFRIQRFPEGTQRRFVKHFVTETILLRSDHVRTGRRVTRNYSPFLGTALIYSLSDKNDIAAFRVSCVPSAKKVPRTGADNKSSYDSVIKTQRALHFDALYAKNYGIFCYVIFTEHCYGDDGSRNCRVNRIWVALLNAAGKRNPNIVPPIIPRAVGTRKSRVFSSRARRRRAGLLMPRARKNFRKNRRRRIHGGNQEEPRRIPYHLRACKK